MAELYNNIYNKDEGMRLYNIGNSVGMGVVGRVFNSHSIVDMGKTPVFIRV